MKTVVCYGDSNTWGFIPKVEIIEWSNNRFAFDTRWTGVMQRKLGADFRVEEEGLNGRTTMFDDPLDERRNGLSYVDVCMLSKMPVDLVVIMLGTNDVKEHLAKTAYCIAKGVGRIIERIQKGGYGPFGAAPEILVVAPAHLDERIADAWPGAEFGAGCLKKDAQLGALYAKISKESGTHFLNAARFITVSPDDCVHLSADAHAVLGEHIAEKVRHILG